MEDDVRILVGVGVTVALIFLSATLMFCAGFGDLLHLETCRRLLDLVISAVRWGARLVGG